MVELHYNTTTTYSSLSALAATMKASYSVTVLLSQSVRLSGRTIPSWRATTTILWW